MQVLILTNEIKAGEEIAKVISYIFPESITEISSINSSFPAKNYDIAFLMNEKGWEAQSQKVVKVTSEVYLVVQDDELNAALLASTEDYGIKKIISKSAISFNGPETKLLIKKFSKAGYVVREYKGVDTSVENSSHQDGNSERWAAKKQQKDENVTESYISKFPSLIIGVFGSKGGTGKTSVSISIAAALAKYGLKKVGIIDFDTKNKGSLTNKLSMKFSKTIGDFVDGIDYEKANDVLVYNKDGGFFVLPGLTDDAESELITMEVVDRIIKFAVSVLDVVIMDLSASLETPTLRGIELCDVVYIVSDTSPDSFDNVSSLQLWPEIYMKLKLIINNVYPEYKKDYAYTIEKIEETKGIKFLGYIRNDRHVNHAWHRQEIPVLSRKCKTFREDFKNIVSDLKPYISNKISRSKDEPKQIAFSFFRRRSSSGR